MTVNLINNKSNVSYPEGRKPTEQAKTVQENTENKIDAANVDFSNPALERIAGDKPEGITAYDRMHHRHNRA